MPDSTQKEGIEACINQDIVFVDRSSPGLGSPIVTWIWDFGDDHTITATSGAPVTHQYQNPGTYTVKLTVINQCNCQNTYDIEVTVNPHEGVKIDCPSVVCEGATTHYKTDAPCGTYEWTVNGGTIISGQNTPDITVHWDNVDASGYGYVLFDSRKDCHVECPNITVIKVPVVLSKGTINGPEVACPYTAVLYRLPQWPATVYNWSITTSGTGAVLTNTDQRNEILLNTSAPGILELKCDYYNTLLKCGGTARIQIEVVPMASLSGPLKACKSTSQTYTSSVPADWFMIMPTGLSVNGPSGTTSWNASLSIAGTYRIGVKGKVCAPEPLLVVVKAPPPAPDSISGPEKACTGIPTKYFAHNAMAGTLFNWSSPTGGVFNSANGGITYATFSSPVSDIVQLTRSWMDLPVGCESPAISRTITRPTGIPEVTGLVTACVNSYVPYNAGSYKDAEEYEWSVVPATLGSVSANQGAYEATVLWNDVPVATPGLVIVKAKKCSTVKIDTLAVTVSPGTTLTITPNNGSGCANLYTVLQVVGTPALTSYANITWSFGNRSFSGPPMLSYQLPNASTNQTYPVSVTVKNPNGCYTQVTANTQFTVLPAPVVSISPKDTLYVCSLGQTITATPSPDYGGPPSITWYYNGTAVGTGNTYFATQPGKYHAVATNPNGCSSITKTLTIIEVQCIPACPGPGPDLNILSNDCGVVEIEANFAAGSMSHGWELKPKDPGGWSQIVSSTPTYEKWRHTFGAIGQYDIIFEAYYLDDSGKTCISRASQAVNVPLAPRLDTRVSCASGQYVVELVDVSGPGAGSNFPTSYDFYEGSTFLGNSTSGTLVLPSVTSGPHSYTMVINRNGTTPCTTSTVITLDPLPTVSFTATLNPACVNEAAVQFVPTPNDSSLYDYLWDFGDSTNNRYPKAARVYGNGSIGTVNAKLTMKDHNGCVFQVAKDILIVEDSLYGFISQSPPNPCMGSHAEVLYNPELYPKNSIPISYAWYKLDDLLPVVSNPIYAYEPDGYRVEVKNKYGCRLMTSLTAVNFCNIPDPVIFGDTVYCTDSRFTMYGYAGNGAYTYTWKRNGVTLQTSPQPNLEQANLPAGVYTYVLTLSMPNPTGGICEKQSQAFVLTVYSLPADPWIDAPALVSCTPYTLSLSAGAAAPGTFNWSNGKSGSPITVYNGGQYRVYFTDVHGCRSKADAFVPRDPNGYLWIFPSGCYSVCDHNFPFSLPGPFGHFNNWEWQQGGVGSVTGNGAVPFFDGSNPDVYNLALDNGLCAATSEPMNVEVKIDGCSPDPCEAQYASLLNVYQQNSETACEWFADLQFFNSSSSPIPYNITSDVGWVNPANGLVPLGGSTHTFQLMLPPAFPGGGVTLTLTYDQGPSGFCEQLINLDLEPCDRIAHQKAGGGNKNAATGEKNAPVLPALQPLLSLAPNPASQTVQIGYRTAASGSIELYDVLGRRVAARAIPAATTDRWNLDVSGFVPGVYQVVLRTEGRVSLHQKLSIQR